MTPRTLYIDGDALLWRATEACQEETWWPGSTTMRTAACDVAAACDDVAVAVNALGTKARADNGVVIVLGPLVKENFRNGLWPEYKMHRRRCDSPVGLHMVKQRLVEEWGERLVLAPSHLEADDVLGRMMTYDIPEIEKVLWSPDKDMLQIPGLHTDDDGRITTISKTEGDYHHLYQTLCGDTSDGYPGCPGMGPVKSKALLDLNPSWASVVIAFKKAKLTEHDALVQARVARILRFGEEPGTWTP